MPVGSRHLRGDWPINELAPRDRNKSRSVGSRWAGRLPTVLRQRLNFRPARAMLQACLSPISSICAFIPPIRFQPARSGSRSWSALCKAERMPAVAITDTGNLFGALEFAMTCSAAGVQPIIGCEIALERGDPEAGSRLGRAAVGAGPDRAAGAERGRLSQPPAAGEPVLSRRRNAERADRSASPTWPGPAMGCSAWPAVAQGPVGRLLAEGQAEAAEAVLSELAAAFPEPALCRADAPRHCRRGAVRAGPDRARLSPRLAAGRDQRRLFPRPRLLRGA